jgi:hypothetical protein
MEFTFHCKILYKSNINLAFFTPSSSALISCNVKDYLSLAKHHAMKIYWRSLALRQFIPITEVGTRTHLNSFSFDKRR